MTTSSQESIVIFPPYLHFIPTSHIIQLFYHSLFDCNPLPWVTLGPCIGWNCIKTSVCVEKHPFVAKFTNTTNEYILYATFDLISHIQINRNFIIRSLNYNVYKLPPPPINANFLNKPLLKICYRIIVMYIRVGVEVWLQQNEKEKKIRNMVLFKYEFKDFYEGVLTNYRPKQTFLYQYSDVWWLWEVGRTENFSFHLHILINRLI